MAQDSDPVGKKDGQDRSPIPQTSIFSCYFLALVHHQLGDADQARAWFNQANAKDAPWEDAMIDCYLRAVATISLHHQRQIRVSRAQ